MALNQDMYDYLVTISDLTDLVSVNSIFWNDFPEGVVTSVTYKMISNPRKYNANPPTRFINSRKNWIQRQMQNFGEFKLEK